MKNTKDSATLCFLKATELAALSSYAFIGSGNSVAADDSAVNSMRSFLSTLDYSISIVAGEGERDKAPLIMSGESLGNRESRIGFEIGLDPLECTNSCANGIGGAMSVLCFGEQGSFMRMPDVYMEKIAFGSLYSNCGISIENDIELNIKIMAEKKQCEISEIRVVILNRPRHSKVIDKIRSIGAKVLLIEDGDIWGSISTCTGFSDMYYGIGGSPEGLLASAALKCFGGCFISRFAPSSEKERSRLLEFNIDSSAILAIDDLVKKDCTFIASGVTNGDFLSGVKFENGKFNINSVVMDSLDKSIRYINNFISL